NIRSHRSGRQKLSPLVAVDCWLGARQSLQCLRGEKVNDLRSGQCPRQYHQPSVRRLECSSVVEMGNLSDTTTHKDQVSGTARGKVGAPYCQLTRVPLG